jgi:hypothetical protein
MMNLRQVVAVEVRRVGVEAHQVVAVVGTRRVVILLPVVAIL